MKRLIALMSAAIIAAGMFTSCRKTYPYDTDKAISLATEYMKDKYGKDIKDVETYKKTHGSDAYIGVKFKLDETDAETPDTNTYEVRVYVDGEGEENHYVKCDNYMNTLFVPFMEEEIGRILEQSGINDYLVVVTRIYQNKARDWDYYTSDFTIPDIGNSLSSYFNNYKIGSDCYINLPDKAKSSIMDSQSCIDFISDRIETLFDDDNMYLTVYMCYDEDFKFAKEHDSTEYKTHISYDKYITKE